MYQDYFLIQNFPQKAVFHALFPKLNTCPKDIGHVRPMLHETEILHVQ
jgi:hypothetical protein